MNHVECVLGNIVREKRKSKNLSQEALAERIGVCKRTIIDIEKNASNPKFEILCLLVRELDLPLYKVFYPDIVNDLEIKSELIQEVSCCSEQEMKIILAIIKSIRNTLSENNV